MNFHQTVILLTGLPAILLTQLGVPELLKWAPVIGILGQPSWLITTGRARQWGMHVLCWSYTFVWALGLYNFWLK